MRFYTNLRSVCDFRSDGATSKIKFNMFCI